MTQETNPVLDIEVSPDGGNLGIDWFLPLEQRKARPPGHDNVDIVAFNDCGGDKTLAVYFDDPPDDRDLSPEDKRDNPMRPRGPQTLLTAAFENGILHDPDQARMHGHDGKVVRFSEIDDETTARLAGLLIRDFNVPASAMTALLRAADIYLRPQP